MEEKKIEIIESEVEEDNTIKTYLDDTIELKEVVKEIKENASK